MFEDTWRLPEQSVLEVFVVIVELSIPSEKVTEIVLLRPVLAESAGEDEETDGAVVSVSTTNELIFNVTLLLEESVTVIVQSE